MAIVLKDVILLGSRSHAVGAATENTHLPILSLVLRTKRCLVETNVLKVIDISEKCSILTKYVGC